MPKSGSYEYAFCLYGHVFWMSSGKCYCKGHSKKCYQKQFVSTECQKVQRVTEEIIFYRRVLTRSFEVLFLHPLLSTMQRTKQSKKLENFCLNVFLYFMKPLRGMLDSLPMGFGLGVCYSLAYILSQQLKSSIRISQRMLLIF